jgi:hypothetical protein
MHSVNAAASSCSNVIPRLFASVCSVPAVFREPFTLVRNRQIQSASFTMCCSIPLWQLLAVRLASKPEGCPAQGARDWLAIARGTRSRPRPPLWTLMLTMTGPKGQRLANAPRQRCNAPNHICAFPASDRTGILKKLWIRAPAPSSHSCLVCWPRGRAYRRSSPAPSRTCGSGACRSSLDDSAASRGLEVPAAEPASPYARPSQKTPCKDRATNFTPCIRGLLLRSAPDSITPISFPLRPNPHAAIAGRLADGVGGAVINAG